MTNYIWDVVRVETEKDETGTIDVVKKIHWILRGEKQNYAASTGGVFELVRDTSVPLLSYDTLTKEQAINWMWAQDSSIQADAQNFVESRLNQQISSSSSLPAPEQYIPPVQ